MASPTREAGAGGQRRTVVGRIAIGRDAIFDRALEAGIFLVEDEVHHARHRVRAIGGGGAAGDDLDALDQALRKGVDVDQAADGRSHRALAVQQHQRARSAERAQVERVDAGGAGRDVEVGIGRRHAADQRRDLVDIVGDVGGRARRHVLRVDHGERRRRLIAVALDARAGDGDLGLRRFGCRLAVLRVLRMRRAVPQQRDRQRGQRGGPRRSCHISSPSSV